MRNSECGVRSEDRTTIRPARSSDIPSLCGLLHDLFSIESDFAPDREKQARALALLIKDTAARSRVFVADSDGIIIGMCSVQTVISTAEGGPAAILEDLVVRRDFRGQGIGTRLLAEVLNWCRQRTISRLHLLADRHNGNAMDYYAGRGWNRTRLLCLRKFL